MTDNMTIRIINAKLAALEEVSEVGDLEVRGSSSFYELKHSILIAIIFICLYEISFH